MEIGKRIVQLREGRGWTTNRLANLCGLSQSFLRAVELGEKGISVENLELVCQALGTSLRGFFDVPSAGEGTDEALRRRLEALTPRQKTALAAFLEAMERERRGFHE